ncbi:MAG: usg protein [Hyphomicrobiaceae bacterium]
MKSRDLVEQLAGYSLTTAEITYRLPDYPSLLQSYVWQDYDLHPTFPRLNKFLAFWRGNLDGSLFRIRISHARLLSPTDVRCVTGGFHLH